jgi:hypothetical protein
MATVYPLSSYSLETIALTVASVVEHPPTFGRHGLSRPVPRARQDFSTSFKLYNSTNYFGDQTFNYGIYVDGVPLAIGDSTTIQYTQTAATPYAIMLGGLLRGTNGFHGYNPIVVPVSFRSVGSQIQIGITNSRFSTIFRFFYKPR